MIREWAAEGGDMRISSYREWKRGRDAPADVTIAKLFGGWRSLVRAAGFEPVARPGPDPSYPATGGRRSSPSQSFSLSPVSDLLQAAWIDIVEHPGCRYAVQSR